jgi:hypothetical protein
MSVSAHTRDFKPKTEVVNRVLAVVLAFFSLVLSIIYLITRSVCAVRLPRFEQRYSPKAIRSSLLLVFSVLFTLVSSLAILYTPAFAPVAEAATNNNINFQARILTNTGALVPDGNYHVEFKIYDSAAAGSSAQGTCSGDSSTDDCWWVETRTTGNLVTVKNGYVTASLGSVTPFPADMPWDQELWLAMNIGGSAGGASWDGEMSPRMKVTAVPYAMRAAQAIQLKTNNGAITSTLNLVAPTGGSQIFQIPDQGAAGTYNLLTQNTANANYIQNQSSTPQTANFYIQSAGSSTVGAVVRGAVSQSAALMQYENSAGDALMVVGANGQLTLGNDTGTPQIGSITFNDNTASNGFTAVLTSAAALSGNVTYRLPAVSAGSYDICTSAGNCLGGGDIIQNGNTYGAPIYIGSNDDFDVNIETNGLSRLVVQNDGDIAFDTNTLFVDAANNRVGILNAAPGNPLSVNTPTTADSLAQQLLATGAAGNKGLVVQAAPSQTANLLELQSSTGDVLSGFNASGNLFYSNSTYNNVLSSATLTANRSIILPDEDGTICLQSSANCGFAPSATNGYVQLAPASAQADATTNSSIYINKTGASGNILQLQNNGSDVVLVSNIGALTLSQLLTANLGATIYGATVSLNDNSNFDTTINTGTSTGMVTIGGNGFIAKNTNDSATSFQIQDTGNASLFTVNTLARTGGQAGNVLKVGNSTGTDTDTTLLVLDGATAAPTTNLASLNGALFYNTTTNKVSAVENGAVVEVCTTGAVCSGYQATPATGSFIKQIPATTAENTIAPTANSVVGLTVNGTSGTAATALAVSQPGAAEGITVTSANNTATNGLSFSGTFTNLINSTNFIVTNAGAVTAVGVNSGTGLLQGTGGLTLTGATSINASGSNATNIGTGTNTGTISIGNSAAGTISLQSGSTIGLTGTTTITGLSTGDALTVNNSTSTGNIFVAQDNGVAVMTVANGGGVLLKNTTDSDSALLVQTSSNIDVLRVNTSTQKVTIGDGCGASPAGSLLVCSAGDAGMTLYADNDNTNENDNPFLYLLQDAGGSRGIIGLVGTAGNSPNSANTYTGTNDNSLLIGIEAGNGNLQFGVEGGVGGAVIASFGGTNGAATFKNTYNSAIAFQIQDTGNASLFTVNTLARTGGQAGNVLKVGNSTGTDTDTTLLVLDGATAAPTTNLASLNGALFYNTTTNKVSAVENGAVVEVCTTGAVCSGYAPASGSANYIQNQYTAQQASSNFWISGTGRADTSILTPALDTATATTLQIGLNNATEIELGKWGVNTNVRGNLVADYDILLEDAGSIDMLNSGTATLKLGQVNATGVEIGSATINTTVNGALATGGNLTVNGGSITIPVTNAGTTFVTPQGSNVTTRLNIPLTNPGNFNQIIAMGLPSGSATSSRVISVFDNRAAGDNQVPLAVFTPDEANVFGLGTDGSNTAGYLKSSGIDLGIKIGTTTLANFSTTTGITLTGTTNINTTGTAATTIGNSSSTLALQGGNSSSWVIGTGGNTTTLNFVAPSGNSTISFPAESGTVCLQGSVNCGFATTTSITLQGAYNNSVGGATAEIVLDSTRGALTVRDNATPLGANLLEVQNNAGTTTYFGVSASGISVDGDITFASGANRNINMLANTTNAAGFNLTVSAGSAGTGASAFGGGSLYLQGGNAAGTGNANGGNVYLSGGAGVGTGVKGLVVTDTQAYSTVANATCGTSCTILQANVDAYGAIIVDATATGIDITLPDPTISTAGRVVYITAAFGSEDFTLIVNGGGQGNEIAMRQNTTATMIWNGTDWTAAGASSSTTLQAAYDNTLTAAGGAEIVLNNTASANGLTVRNNISNPIIGAIFETQTAIGSNLFSVNNNAIEYATNGGAETQGASASTFPAGTWSAAPDGGTVSRYTTLGDYISTGQASVSVVTSAAIDQGADNTLTSALTPNLRYRVSYAVRSTASFTTLDTHYSRDGTTTAMTDCETSSTVTQGIWTRIICTFDAPASGITTSNAIIIHQNDATARTFYIENLSVTVSADVNHAVDGDVDDPANFSTYYTAAPAGGTVSRSQTTLFNTSGSAQVVTTATANQGLVNNLNITPQTNTQYLVSFYALSSNTFNDINIAYSRDGGSSTVMCTDYNTQSVSDSTWTKISCVFTTDGTSPTNADLIITQGSATARTFWVDALSVTLNTNTASNVQIGGGNYGGPVTLFTLDRSDGPPIAANNPDYFGSMYYDTTTGRIQCYEADGWGACGSPPDNFVNLNPEYAGAVLNGTGIGTMNADLCANESGVLQVNSTLCGTGESKNYYNWTSPQASQQTYSIYVSYQLPTTFKGFSSDDTVQLTARVSNTTNAAVTYEMFRSENGSLVKCGTGETTVTTSANTWQTVGINGNEATGCGFTTQSAEAYVIFKINMKANSNANAYVSTLSFITTGK